MARFERPRRPHSKSRGGGVWGFISRLVSVLIIAAVVGVIGMFAMQAETNRPGPSQQATDFVVERGATVNTIGRGLQRAGVIRDVRVFRVALPLRAQQIGASGRI